MRTALIALALVTATACYQPYVPPETGTGMDSGSSTGPDLGCAPDGRTMCLGPELNTCTSGDWTPTTMCAEPTPACDNDLGCVVCRPNSTWCDGQTIMQCSGDGSGSAAVSECEAPLTCNSGACKDPCDPSALAFSYLGCDFLAVSTTNALLAPAFDNDFAVVVGAPAGGRAANVTVSRGGATVATAVVPAGQTAAISLPMVAGLKSASQTGTVVGGAYQVHTDQPVAAYQYNPLNFTVAETYSYTNDASLLLPEHVLTEHYRVSTWPTWGAGSWNFIPFLPPDGEWGWYPDFVAISATQDNTQVNLVLSGNTAAGTPGATPAGGTMTVTLNRGDVLQVLSGSPGASSDLNACTQAGGTFTQTGTCPPTLFGGDCEGWCSLTTSDLTGTTVTASAPIAVFAGHQCTNMPYTATACDHLEEMMFPLETWGTQVVLSAPAHPAGSGAAPALYRVLANADGTTIEFDPPVSATTTLNAGKFVAFQSDQDFMVRSTSGGPIYVTQALLGQDAPGMGSGDPALGTGVPWRQWRSDYDFLTPSTYTANYVNVIAQEGASVQLDGAAVGGFAAIGGTGFTAARVPVTAGSHHIASTDGSPFGITTYGYASYTSYLFPGGMNFKR